MRDRVPEIRRQKIEKLAKHRSRLLGLAFGYRLFEADP